MINFFFTSSQISLVYPFSCNDLLLVSRVIDAILIQLWGILLTIQIRSGANTDPIFV